MRWEQDGWMTDSTLWTGPAVALVTLFDDDLAVLPRETAAHAARLVGAGMKAVLVAGSTGEAAALTDDERVALVAAVKQTCPDVPVVAGSTGEWAGQAAERTAQAVKAGADAVLVAPPRLGGSLTDYFGRVAEAADGVPVLAYHFPGVAGGEVPVDALAGLPLAGIKDSSGDAGRLAVELDWAGGAVYTGSASLTGYASWLGAAGAILAVANLVPDLALAAWDRDPAAQRELLRTERACRAVPGGLKAALAERTGSPAGRRLG
jgi:4-hydroxy-tetrahydrodipicolinate synthase